MKSKNLFRVAGMLLLCLLITIFSSCSDDDNDGGNTPDGGKAVKPDYSATIKTAVHGFITDDKDQPLGGVLVTANDKTVFTDEYGYFEIPEAHLVKDIAFVKAEKNGYFNGIRTWRGTQDVRQLVRIKLLPKTLAGTITASAGGEVTATSGVKLTFPQNAVVTLAGAPYDGKVNVAVQWLNPMAADFSETMPGDLTAINADGNMRTLISYGMAGVELSTESGDVLKVAPNTDIKITTPIPAEMQSIAPASMPLWAFDETKGIWVEEGVTNKVGNEYVGNVRHFSWWNVDWPENFVELRCRFVDSEGKPVQGVKVEVKNISQGYRGTCFTDQQGAIRRMIPKNSAFEIAGYSPISDECLLVGMSFVSKEEDVDLGTMIVPKDMEVKVSGKVLECDGTNANGTLYYTMKGKYNKSVVPIVDGKYEFTLLICKEEAIDFEIKSTSNFKRSITITKDSPTYTIETFTNECREAVITGLISNCNSTMPVEGYAIFKSRYRELRKDIMGDNYRVSFQLPFDRDSESGTITIYSKSGDIYAGYNISVGIGVYTVDPISVAQPIIISGMVNGCDNKPLKNGEVSLSSEYYYERATVVNGAYSIRFDRPIRCQEEQITLTVRDFDTMAETVVQAKMNSGNNIISPITICDTGGLNRYNHIVIEIRGTKYQLRDYMWAHTNFEGTDPGIRLNAGGGSILNGWAHLNWSTPTMSTGVFDINDSSCSIYNGNSVLIDGELTGKTTVTLAQKSGDQITVVGTFAGKISYYDELSNTQKFEDVTGSFFYKGSDERPH